MKTESQGPRVNDAIRVREVRVIVDSTGEQLGIIPTIKALQLAQDQGLDLVEVADNTRPPVCKIMDYGAFKFKRAKALREAKKSATKIEIKEMRFTPRTAENDFNVKVRKIKEFLEEGHRVTVTVKFRGREKAHLDLGKELLNKMVLILGDLVTVDTSPKLDGDKMTMILTAKR